MQSLERYLHLMGHLGTRQIVYLSRQFCKFAAHKAELCLVWRPSEIAAAALTLALNVSSSAAICEAQSLEFLDLANGK